MAQIILTNSARRKITEHNLSQKIIEEVIQHGNRRPSNREPGITEFTSEREFGTVTAIGKHTPKGDWLILTCWLRKMTGNNAKFSNSPKKKKSFLEEILDLFSKILGKK